AASSTRRPRDGLAPGEGQPCSRGPGACVQGACQTRPALRSAILPGCDRRRIIPEFDCALDRCRVRAPAVRAAAPVRAHDLRDLPPGPAPSLAGPGAQHGLRLRGRAALDAAGGLATPAALQPAGAAWA